MIRSISRKASHGSASRRLTWPPREYERSSVRKNEDKRCTLRINKPALNTEVAYIPPLFPSDEIYRMGRQAVHNAAQLKLKQGNHVKGGVSSSSLSLSFSLLWTQFLWCRHGGIADFSGRRVPEKKAVLFRFILVGRCELTLGRVFEEAYGFRLRQIHHCGTPYYRSPSFSLHFRDSLPRLSGLSEISV